MARDPPGIGFSRVDHLMTSAAWQARTDRGHTRSQHFLIQILRRAPSAARRPQQAQPAQQQRDQGRDYPKACARGHRQRCESGRPCHGCCREGRSHRVPCQAAGRLVADAVHALARQTQVRQSHGNDRGQRGVDGGAVPVPNGPKRQRRGVGAARGPRDDRHRVARSQFIAEQREREREPRLRTGRGQDVRVGALDQEGVACAPPLACPGEANHVVAPPLEPCLHPDLPECVGRRVVAAERRPGQRLPGRGAGVAAERVLGLKGAGVHRHLPARRDQGRSSGGCGGFERPHNGIDFPGQLQSAGRVQVVAVYDEGEGNRVVERVLLRQPHGRERGRGP